MTRLWLFASLFVAVILLADQTVQDENFYWPVTEERDLPEVPKGIDRCPRSFKPYVVVVAGTRHKAEWLNDVGSDVESIIYQQEHPDEPNFYTRHGNEVGAYLRFLIDYYNCLPNVTAFVHGHEDEGWHSFNMRDTIRALQWHLVPGYTDLNRKPGIWDLDLRNRRKYPSHHPVATGDDVFSGKYPPQAIIGGNAYDPEETFHWCQQEANVHAYDNFFGRAGLGAMPDIVRFPCCSQFAVTREAVHLRSRFFWQQNIHYMEHNDIQASNLREKSHMVGDIWTPFWPMLFGEKADYERRIPDEELFR